MSKKKQSDYYDPRHYTLVHNRYLARLKSHENRTKPPDDAHCVWAVDDFDGSYDTSCGNKFQFTDAGPEENGMVYCCYCGRILGTVGEPPAADAIDRAAEVSTDQPPREKGFSS